MICKECSIQTKQDKLFEHDVMDTMSQVVTDRVPLEKKGRKLKCDRCGRDIVIEYARG